jgi:hypothetical protein
MKYAVAIAMIIACPILAGFTSGVSIQKDKSLKRPIIAQLIREPQAYAGQEVVIYGLVIESVSDSVFILQDVSQMPLKIVGRHGVKARAGDQVMISGVFKTGKEGPVFFADQLLPTRVLGGGGCC